MAHPKSVVWLREPLADVADKWVPAPSTIVTSPRQFAMVCDASTLTFVDGSTLKSPVLESASGPIIAICDDPLQTAISWMHEYPWLHHVVSASTLSGRMAKDHIKNVANTLTSRATNLKGWLGPDMHGRRVQLTQASKRGARLERMLEFFAAFDVSPRGRESLRDAADELLTNAFYDAPVAAGAMSSPIARTQDVVLPSGYGCEIAYGCSDELAFVRVRDPFGSLSRRRLIEVLVRCSGKNVAVDTSMGGAGLGLWRIFANAAFVSISVSKGRHTEFLVGIPKQRQSRKLHSYAIHLFFHDSQKRRRWKWADSVVADAPRTVTITFT